MTIVSESYRKLREELFEAERELMEHRERVAALRRALPRDQKIDDYQLEGAWLSELFSAPDQTLIVYHFMYGKAQTSPCPMCTMWIDGYDAVAPHVEQRADFVVLAAAGLQALERFAESRGWSNIRLVGAGDGTFKRDLGSENEAGEQSPMISVFRREGDDLFHFYSANADMNEHGQRGIDLLSPVWNLFDLTPEGRGDWYPSLSY
jgi:predicted dithiol-disulfide oxidoreductase (DUF899 family)